MKILKSLLILALGLGLSFSAVSCGGNTNSAEQTEEAAQSAMEAMEAAEEEGNEEDPAYTSAYVCPMHCEGSGSDEPGKCPVCGMDYVANPDHAKDQHEH